MICVTPKWFVQINDRVDGPFSTEDVQSRVQSGQFSDFHLIWGVGLDQWKKIGWWARELPNMGSHETHTRPPENWHYALGGQSYGPFQRQELISELRKVESLKDVLLWTRSMKDWAPLFEFHDILTDLGVNKREFPRADVSGKVILRAEGQTLVGNLRSISEGGLGVQVDQPLVAGQQLQVEIQSSSLRTTISAKAEVRYVSHGVTGMRFLSLSDESRGAIIQLVRQHQARFIIKAA